MKKSKKIVSTIFRLKNTPRPSIKPKITILTGSTTHSPIRANLAKRMCSSIIGFKGWACGADGANIGNLQSYWTSTKLWKITSFEIFEHKNPQKIKFVIKNQRQKIHSFRVKFMSIVFLALYTYLIIVSLFHQNSQILQFEGPVSHLSHPFGV